ncbi:MAG: hypothetical protein C0413_02130 [Clostridiales bacterium]|nr:hypothetical protein [Clostridiales bacterium]
MMKMKQKTIRLSATGIRADYDVSSQVMTVYAGERIWQTQADGAYIEYEHAGRTLREPLSHAGSICTKPVSTGTGQGVEVRYSGFAFDRNLAFYAYWWLDATSMSLDAAIVPIREPKSQTWKIHYPAPFVFDTMRPDNYTVFPLMQGAIIPNGYEQSFDLSGRWELESGTFYTRSAYMPWWGQIEGRKGYMALALTPFDGGFSLAHESSGATSVGTAWLPSLGKLAYTRTIRFLFSASCDYVSFCKEYRAYLKQTGRFKTLAEKELQNPLLKKLHGCAVITACAELSIAPSCRFYGTPEATPVHETFIRRAYQLFALKERGLKHAYFHLDGWVREGYDAQHPDVWPPSEAAGGLAGLLALQKSVHDCGWLFALHDQYRDYYLDAPSYLPDLTKKNRDGEIPVCDYWAGGKQAFLCPSQSLAFIRRNYTLLRDNGVVPDGVYLDVFACVGLDECWDERHRVTREACMQFREACFDYMRANGSIISSEEGIGWAMYSLDLVHHANYALEMLPDETTLCGIPTGRGFGIPVPLLNLVYHDCVVTPWFITPGTNEMPDGQSGLLHALLNAGIPYVDIEATAEEISTAEIVCALHRRLSHTEMVRHELLDGVVERQRTVFSDGTQITVDFSTGEYDIQPPLAR